MVKRKTKSSALGDDPLAWIASDDQAKGKAIKKAKNKKTIMVYYALAIISISIGMFTGRTIYNVVAFTLIGLALFRKYFLMKKLKE